MKRGREELEKEGSGPQEVKRGNKLCYAPVPTSQDDCKMIVLQMCTDRMNLEMNESNYEYKIMFYYIFHVFRHAIL